MVLRTIEDIEVKARALDKPRKVAVAAAEHDHVIEAVLRAKKDGFVDPILIGRKAEIKKMVEEFGGDIPDEQYIDIPSNDPNEIAAEAVKLVREKKADFIMKGLLNTSEVLRAVLNKETGLEHDKVVTQFSLMQIPGVSKLVVLNDGAIIPHPTFEQKVEQIKVVSRTLRNLGYDQDIKVAVLCAAETYNPKIPESVDALKLKEMGQNGEFPGCYVEGPISLDISLLPEAAEIKGFDSPVAGDADVLLVPNLTSGNFTAKMVNLFGGISVGMVIGAGAPIALTSRAATAQAKYRALALAASAVKEAC